MREAAASTPLTTSAARVVTLLVAAAFFMEMLDGTVIATALPTIGMSFGVDPVALNIGMTAYLLALAVFIPVGGWVADRVGARPVFAGAIALFTVASILCGVSEGLWSFAGARLLQGIGGAAMVPVGRLIVLRTTRKEDLVGAIGTIVWPGLVAPVLGPPLGGFIVLHASWPWIFFLNVPLGILAIVLTLLLVPKIDASTSRRSFDVAGFLLVGGALAAVVGGVDVLGHGPSHAGWPLLAIVAGLALGILGVRHLRRHPTPLLNLAPFGIGTFAVVAAGGSLLRMSIGALPFLLPLLFQLGLGLDALTSGLLVLCVFAGNLVMKLFTTRVLRRFGFRQVMLVNGVLAAVSIALCALIGPSMPLWLVALILFAGGAFRSMQFTGLSTIQFADVPPEWMTDANTLAAMLQQVTLGLGIVVGAALLNASAWAHGRGAGSPTIVDYRVAFVVAAVIALVGLFDTRTLARDAGQRLSGHVPRRARAVGDRRRTGE